MISGASPLFFQCKASAILGDSKESPNKYTEVLGEWLQLGLQSDMAIDFKSQDIQATTDHLNYRNLMHNTLASYGEMKIWQTISKSLSEKLFENLLYHNVKKYGLAKTVALDCKLNVAERVDERMASLVTKEFNLYDFHHLSIEFERPPESIIDASFLEKLDAEIDSLAKKGHPKKAIDTHFKHASLSHYLKHRTLHESIATTMNLFPGYSGPFKVFEVEGKSVLRGNYRYIYYTKHFDFQDIDKGFEAELKVRGIPPYRGFSSSFKGMGHIVIPNDKKKNIIFRKLLKKDFSKSDLRYCYYNERAPSHNRWHEKFSRKTVEAILKKAFPGRGITFKKT